MSHFFKLQDAVATIVLAHAANQVVQDLHHFVMELAVMVNA